VTIERFSSRREALGDLLGARLAGATRYLRIAGYFRSSLLDVVGEALERVGEIRVVCNGDLDPFDVRLGAQVNVDLPWNPSRLEQRKGRIQRIGQARDQVHILNLRYAGTVEDKVYAALSARFGDIFQVLGQLPDAFEDDWIAAVLGDRADVRNFSQRVDLAKPPMELRYLRHVADDEGLDWEYTEKVLSSRDLDEWMRRGW
jgi:hypothetical protein